MSAPNVFTLRGVPLHRWAKEQVSPQAARPPARDEAARACSRGSGERQWIDLLRGSVPLDDLFRR